MQPGSGDARVSLLGPVQVHIGTQQVHLRGRRQRIALTRLALGEGRPVSVDALVEDLWEEDPPGDAPHALQAHMSRLRNLLSIDIEFVNDGYRLCDATVGVDSAEFTRLCDLARSELGAGDPGAAAANFDAALSLWRGPALHDLSTVPGLQPFVLQLEELRRVAEMDRIEAYLQGERGEAIIDELHTTLSVDPLQERAWHQLLRALWQTGREAEALAAYGRAREAFIDELGVEPGTKLSQLHTALLNSAPASDDRVPVPAPPPAAPPGPAEHGGPELIGRERELEVLEAAWHRSRSGLQVVTLSGEPGIGKTRLAEEFSRRVRAAGARVLGGRCDRVSTPYQPFAQMLRAYLGELGDDENTAELRRRTADLAKVFPEIAEHYPVPAASAHDHHPAMDAVAAWFSSMSRDHPILLTIDDVHWADEQTLLLVQSLLRGPRRINALLVVCVRDRQVPPGEDSRLAEVFRQSAALTHVPLTRFTDAQTTALIGAEEAHFPARAELPEWADEYVRGVCGGNPLFAVELTRQLLMADPGTGQVPPPPEGVTRVVDGRIARLPTPARTLLRDAAVAGVEFDLTLLAAARDAFAGDLDADLQPALRTRLVEPLGGGGFQYVFSHEIVRSALYESLPPAQRAHVHTRLAWAISAGEEAGPAETHQLLAHHYRNSDLPGGSRLAAKQLYLAGTSALARGAPAEAVTLLTDALDLGPDDALRCDVLTSLGAAQLQLAQPTYRNTFLAASRLASSIGDVERLTAAVLANNRGWWSSTAQVDHERIADIETALARCPAGDLSSRSQLLTAWALENVRDPSARAKVLRASGEALELVERSGDEEALASVLAHRYTVMHALLEEPGECVHLNERLLGLASRHGDQQMRLSAALGLAQASMRLGKFSIADRYLTESAQLAEKLNHPPRLWLVRGWQAMRTATSGHLAAAEELAAEAVELGARIGQEDAFTWFAGQIYTFRLLQGRLPEIVEEVRTEVQEVGAAIPSWRAALALALARSGYRDEASAIVEELAADSFAHLPRDMLWLHGLHYLTQACETLQRADVAEELYRLLLPYSGMVASNGTVDAGPVDLHLGMLAQLRGQDDIADQHLRAAATLCRRIGAPTWVEQATARMAHGNGPRSS